MSKIILPADPKRAANWLAAGAIPLKYLRHDGSVTAPEGVGFEHLELPADPKRAALWNAAGAEPVKYILPDGSIVTGPGLYEMLGEAFYNSVEAIDVTLREAPDGSARAHNWFVLMTGQLVGTYQYSRYLYNTSFITPTTTPVARWVIDGKHIFFEFFDETGAVSSTTDITDANGNPLISRFQPIGMTELWFFGPNDGDPFPTDDTVRSMLYVNASVLWQLMGDPRDLITTEQTLVPAINEIAAGLMSRQNFRAVQGMIVPDNADGVLNDVFVSGSGVYLKTITTPGNGLVLSGVPAPNTQFNGLWIDMGIDTEGTANGDAQGANWYAHESGLYVLKWSLYQGGSGYYWINDMANRKADDGNARAYAMASKPATPQTLPPPSFNLNMGGGSFTCTWVWQTGSGDPVEGWVKIY
jgi:hypothetical protein